ncbi:MAG: hypothetical protein ACLTEE_02585 [Anaerobutyricum hallii]
MEQLGMVKDTLPAAPSYKAGELIQKLALYVTDTAYSATPISRTYTITRANTHIINQQSSRILRMMVLHLL